MSTPTAQAQPSLFKRLVFFAVLAIALMGLVASSVAATSAYFSDTDDGTVRISTGEVAVALSDGDLRFTGLMPGDTESDEFTVSNTGDGSIDVYGWIEVRATEGDNICADELNGHLEARVVGSGHGWMDVCELAADLDEDFDSYPAGDLVPLLLTAGNIDPIDAGEDQEFDVEVRLSADAGNEWADLTTWGGSYPHDDTFMIYATQASAPEITNPDDLDL